MTLLRGVAKATFEAVLDEEFLQASTPGLEEYRALCAATPWSDLVAGAAWTSGPSALWRSLHEVRAGDHGLVPGRHAA